MYIKYHLFSHIFLVSLKVKATPLHLEPQVTE